MPGRPQTPQSLFDRVAPYYDVVNSCLSLGQDRRWRRRAARFLDLPAGGVVLDVATGTASLALAVASLAQPDSRIIACDLNEPMLQVGRRRTAGKEHIPQVELVCCSGTCMPFPDAAFDAATIAFAIDDMPSREACAQEMFRVLRAYGALVLLELSLPRQPLFLSLYRFYTLLMSLMGRVFRLRGYKHLREEILGYRGGLAIQQLLESAGFVKYASETLSGGLATLHRVIKPNYAAD
jgi:ubiquinone/menaquinone biosynthesis methyltransferase